MTWTRRAERLSDEALLSAIALGDADACLVFVRRHQRKVYGVAITMVGDPRLAEDIAQQAFERAWRQAAAFDPRRASATTWLCMLTRRIAIDSLRTRRAVPVDPDTLLELVAVDRASPEAAAVHSDEISRVRTALASLPHEQQRAVMLSAFGALTAIEVAAIERIPIGTAKTRLRLGLARLRSQLLPEESHDL